MLKITIGENTTHKFEGEWWGYMRNVLYLTSNLKIKQKKSTKAILNAYNLMPLKRFKA